MRGTILSVHHVMGFLPGFSVGFVLVAKSWNTPIHRTTVRETFLKVNHPPTSRTSQCRVYMEARIVLIDPACKAVCGQGGTNTPTLKRASHHSFHLAATFSCEAVFPLESWSSRMEGSFSSGFLEKSRIHLPRTYTSRRNPHTLHPAAHSFGFVLLT